MNDTTIDGGMVCIPEGYKPLIFGLAKLYFPLMVMNTCQLMILIYVITHLAVRSDIFMWSPLIIIFSIFLMVTPILLFFEGSSFYEYWTITGLAIGAFSIVLIFLTVVVRCPCTNRWMSLVSAIILIAAIVVCIIPVFYLLTLDDSMTTLFT